MIVLLQKLLDILQRTVLFTKYLNLLHYPFHYTGRKTNFVRKKSVEVFKEVCNVRLVV